MGSRSKRQFVPEEFTVPSELVTANFTLRMLSVDDVEKDFEAVTSSAERLRKVWPDSGWPDGLTLRQNLVDLGWHEKEFKNRTSFAYTMVAPDESQVLGCVYFYPTDKAGYDAEVFLWVRKVKRRGTWIRSYSRSCNTGWRRTGLSKILPILAEPLAGNTGTHCPLNKSASVPAQAHT